jgi:hypothetical protein
MTYDVMSSTYSVDLAFYKDMKHDLDHENSHVLRSMAKEMIYYNHWSNLVMYEYLQSSNDIEVVIGSLEIKTIDEYFESNNLF